VYLKTKDLRALRVVMIRLWLHNPVILSLPREYYYWHELNRTRYWLLVQGY